MSGVRTETLDSLEFEAGLILKSKYTGGNFTKDLVLCATTGGIRVNIGQMKQSIKFDGMKENTAGLERVVGWTGGCQFSTKEVNAEKVKMALGYAETDLETTENVSKTTVTLKQGIIPVSEYHDCYILGKLSNGSWRQVCLTKAMNVNGLQETRNDKNEVEIAFDLQARYTIDDQDTAPISIEYITG